MNKDLLGKARAAKSAEELLELAKANSVELTEAEAAEHFSQLHQSGELSDEELSAVSGGGCHTKDGRLVVSNGYGCDGFICKRCGSRNREMHVCSTNSTSRTQTLSSGNCSCCQFYTYEKGLWLCNNPINIK